MPIHTSSNQIAENIYRLTVAPNEHFEFSSFLITDAKSCLVHAGKISLFEPLFKMVKEVLKGKSLDYLVFSHVEGDESGATNKWLESFEQSQLVCSKLSNMSISDSLLRPARILKDGESLELGGKSLTMIETPHFPHNWDAHMWFENESKTLFSSDFCCQGGLSAGVVDKDPSDSIIQFYEKVGFIPYGKSTNAALDKIENYDFKTIAPMHGPFISEEFARTTFESVKNDLISRS